LSTPCPSFLPSTPSELIHSSKKALHSNLYQAFVNVEVRDFSTKHDIAIYLELKLLNSFNKSQSSLLLPNTVDYLCILNSKLYMFRGK
jgi:hypothetical protein